MYTIVKQSNQIENNLRAAKLQKRREDYITNLLRLLSSEKALRKRAHLKKWQVVLLTLVFDYKKENVAPGSVVACSVPDFIRDFFEYANQKPKMNEYLIKHNLYDDEDKDYEYRVAVYDGTFDTIMETLCCFSKFSALDDGIYFYADSVILYRDMLPEHQDQAGQNDDSQAEYNDAEEDKDWLMYDFDWVIDTFIENNTDEYTTVLSEEDFFNRFKEYAESTLLSETSPISGNENRKKMLIKLVSSIEYFYSSLYKRNKLKETSAGVSWDMEIGYVVLHNEDLTDEDHRLSLV